jgi:hypothetical protein
VANKVTTKTKTATGKKAKGKDKPSTQPKRSTKSTKKE